MNVLTELIVGKHNPFYKKIIDIEKSAIELRLRSGFSFVDNLPNNIVDKKFTVNDIEFEQGDIISRPIYNKFSKFLIHHYGVYYGTDSSGDHWFIDKDADGYIHVRVLEDFMKEINFDEIGIIKKPSDTTIEEIIERAKTIEHEPYTAMENNCQHFLGYAVFGKYESIAVDQMKKNMLDKFKRYREWRKNHYF